MEFVGFQTGNKNSIFIHPDKIHEAKARFDYDSQDISQAVPISHPYNSAEFQTVNLKSLSVNSTNLSNGRALLESESQQNKLEIHNELQAVSLYSNSLLYIPSYDGSLNNSGNTNSIRSDLGCSSGKNIENTDLERNTIELNESLKDKSNSQVIDLEFNSESLSELFAALESEEDYSNFSSGFVGFQTGNREKIPINPESLQKAEALFNEKLEIINNSTAGEFCEFHTGNKKPVPVKVESFQKVASLFKDDADMNSTIGLSLDSEFSTGDNSRIPIYQEKLHIMSVRHDSDSDEISILRNTDLTEPRSLLGIHQQSQIININSKRNRNWLDQGLESVDQVHRPQVMNISIGFCTGNNNPIGINSESLRRAQTLLGGDSQGEFDFKLKDIKNQAVGFSSGNNCSEAANKESLQKPQSLLCRDSQGESDFKPMEATYQSIGFRTGNNNPIAVNPESFQRFKSILETNSQEGQNIELTDAQNQSIGFSTEHSNPISVNTESLRRAQSLLCDDSQEESNRKPREAANQSIGFLTGNKNPISVRAESLKIAQSLFETDSQEKSFLKPRDLPYQPIGFSTGNNNPISVNAERLRKAQSLFEADSQETSFLKQRDAPNQSIGFRTGNQNAIPINAERLRKAQSLFEADSQETSFLKPRDAPNQSIGFSTGNLNVISVNAESLKRAQSLFEADSQQELAIKPRDVPNQSIGFLTGNQNIISINPESLKRAQSLFEADSQQTQQENPLQNSTAHKNPLISNDKPSELPAKYQLPNRLLDSVYPKKPENRQPLSRCTNLLTSAHSSISSQSTSQYSLATKAYELKLTRRELSCNSGLRPNFALQKFITPPIKRKFDSNAPTRKIKTEPIQKVSSFLLSKESSISLHSLNSFKPLQGFKMSPALNLSLKDCSSFIFSCQCSTFCLCNGSKTITYTEIHSYLLKEKLICTEDWVRNHYRFSVWKYASYDRRLSSCEGIFSILRILEDIKRRWHVENEKGMRSILKRITDGDELSTRRMILCIGEVDTDHLELTDGWYSITAAIPTQNEKIVKQLKSGTKVNVCFMEKETERYKIHLNSFRRAAWYEKLGAVKSNLPFVVNLKSLYQDGGMVPCIDVIIVKRYAIKYSVKIEDITYRFNASSVDEFINSHVPKDPEDKLNTQLSFTIMVKDALSLTHEKHNDIAFISIYENASTFYEELKPNTRIKLYVLKPARYSRNNKLHMNYLKMSKIKYVGRIDQDYSYLNPYYHHRMDYDTECDIVGVILKIYRNSNRNVFLFTIATEDFDLIEVVILSDTFHGASLRKLKVSYFKEMTIICILNARVKRKSYTLNATEETEFYTKSPPAHLLLKYHEISQSYKAQVKTFMNLMHDSSCDEYGCVCNLIHNTV